MLYLWSIITLFAFVKTDLPKSKRGRWNWIAFRCEAVATRRQRILQGLKALHKLLRTQFKQWFVHKEWLSIENLFYVWSRSYGVCLRIWDKLLWCLKYGTIPYYKEHFTTLAVESIAFNVLKDPIFFGHKSNSIGNNFLGLQFWAWLEMLENHFALNLFLA